MTRKKAIFFGAGLLLVAANVFLTLHNDSKVSQSSFITKWFVSETENLVETLKTEGVVVPAEKHQVYYHPEQGGFEGFLVEEGDQVAAGTPLYEYSSARIDADRQRLENELAQLNREVALIDDQIQQLEYLQMVSTTAVEIEGDANLTAGTLVDMTIEKEIYDKAREQSRLLTEIEDYEDQISALDEGGEVNITSEISGTILDVNDDLSNPIMTIISDTPKVSGTFAEADLGKVREGMEAYVNSDLAGGIVEGTLDKIASYPEGEPAVGKESQFPFEIELIEEPSGEEESPLWKMVHGTHVEVTVVTNKVDGAVTVANEQIKNGSYVYVLTQAGKIERRDIRMGLEVGKRVEIVEGLGLGETVVANPYQVAQVDQPFITRLDMLKLRPEPYEKMEWMDMVKAVGVGFSKQ